MTNFNQTVSNFVNHNTSRYPRDMRAQMNPVKNEQTYEFVKAMKNLNDYNNKQTENGANSKNSTNVKLYDLFALGGSYRSRTESECVLLFKEAYQENPEYALKCLFYLRDILEGQGERRFFRVCLKWLAGYDKKAVLRNLAIIAREGFGRWDDLFVLFDTSCEDAVMKLIEEQITLDLKAYQANAAVSLLGKWLPSENSSSAKTKHDARRIINALHVTPREYRKILSALRERIKVVERLMSQNRWSEIDFSHLPSRAGLIYRKAFERRDIIQEKYREFARDTSTKVNAGALYPYDVVKSAISVMHPNNYWSHSNIALDNTQRLMVNKYWDNLKDYFNGGISNMMVVADTSGSMTGTCGTSIAPITIATSLAIYAAERAKGPFAGHYISFSRNAKLIEVRGVDFCDKVDRIVRANLCEDTNIESVFDLVLDTAMRAHLSVKDIPGTLVIVSDMEVNRCSDMHGDKSVFMDKIRRKWNNKCKGRYAFPNLVYWNCAARNNTFIDEPRAGVTFVSGASPVLFEQVLKGVSSIQLMMDKLNSERYKGIH